MSLSQKLLQEGRGILRLAPTWVPRAFCIPGRRIKLHPDDYYALGGKRGGIDERWLASTTFAENGQETPAYEGAVDLVSDISGQYAFRQIEGTLPDGRRALVIWRTVTDDVIASNAALDAYFTTYRKNAQDRKYDVIFVNGDSNLENLRSSSEGWKVQVTEIEFKNRMFEEV